MRLADAVCGVIQSSRLARPSWETGRCIEARRDEMGVWITMRDKRGKLAPLVLSGEEAQADDWEFCAG